MLREWAKNCPCGGDREGKLRPEDRMLRFFQACVFCWGFRNIWKPTGRTICIHTWEERMTAQNPRELSNHPAITCMLLETNPNSFWLLWAELLREHHHLVSLTQEVIRGKGLCGQAQCLLFGLVSMLSLLSLSPFALETLYSCLNSLLTGPPRDHLKVRPPSKQSFVVMDTPS